MKAIPVLYNALLRCTRADNLAEGVFGLTRDDLGLWVLELSEYDAGESLESKIE